MTRWNLGPLLAPRSIAIVGASESPDSWAPEIERSLRHVGYEGEPVPDQPEVRRGVGPAVPGFGRASCRAASTWWCSSCPARVVVRMVDECGAAGVRAVMVVSSGFAEAGEEGRALQDGAARRGPAPSAARARSRTSRGSSTTSTASRRTGRRLRRNRSPVRSASSRRSGTVAWAMNQLASDRGVGLRIILGVGNEAVLGLGDLFAWAAADPHTKVVCTYIETMRDVEGIGRGLDALRAARKPVLVCAPGRAERGGPPIDRGAHRRARRQHGAPRRLAPRARRDPRRGPRHDVRGGRAAVVRHADANDRRRGGAAVRRGVHPVRRGGRRAGPGAARSSRARRSAGCGRRCRTSRRRTTRST